MKLAPTTTHCGLRAGDQRIAVGAGAQVMHVRQIGAGQIEAHGVSAGRD